MNQGREIKGAAEWILSCLMMTYMCRSIRCVSFRGTLRGFALMIFSLPEGTPICHVKVFLSTRMHTYTHTHARTCSHTPLVIIGQTAFCFGCDRPPHIDNCTSCTPQSPDCLPHLHTQSVNRADAHRPGAPPRQFWGKSQTLFHLFGVFSLC